MEVVVDSGKIKRNNNFLFEGKSARRGLFSKNAQ